MIEKAIKYGIEILGLQDVCLDIYFEKGMDVCGEILCDDESLEICIDSTLRVKEMIITIFHELVHARQYIDGNIEMPDEEAYTKEMIIYHDFCLTLIA